MSFTKPNGKFTTIAQALGKNYKPPRPKVMEKPKDKPICPHCGSQNSRQKNETIFRKCKDCQKLFITPNYFFKNKKF